MSAAARDPLLDSAIARNIASAQPQRMLKASNQPEVPAPTPAPPLSASAPDNAIASKVAVGRVAARAARDSSPAAADQLRAGLPARIAPTAVSEAGVRGSVRQDAMTDVARSRVRPQSSASASAPRAREADSVAIMAGTWRGVANCIRKSASCHDETVVYHVVPHGEGRYSVQMNKLVNGLEEWLTPLGCTVNSGGSLVCEMPPQGTWRFEQRADSLVGELLQTDGTPLRSVRVRRQ